MQLLVPRKRLISICISDMLTRRRNTLSSDQDLATVPSQINANRLQIFFELYVNYTGDATVDINENAKHMVWRNNLKVCLVRWGDIQSAKV